MKILNYKAKIDVNYDGTHKIIAKEPYTVEYNSNNCIISRNGYNVIVKDIDKIIEQELQDITQYLINKGIDAKAPDKRMICVNIVEHIINMYLHDRLRGL